MTNHQETKPAIENPKELFDALAEWKRGEFERIQERREGEWKCTLAIWGGLAAVLLGMLKTETIDALRQLPPWALFVAAAAVIVMHGAFLWKAGERHHENRKVAIEASKRMAGLLRIPPPDDPKFQPFDWSRLVQLGMSVFLVMLLFVLYRNVPTVAGKLSPIPPPTTQSGASKP